MNREMTWNIKRTYREKSSHAVEKSFAISYESYIEWKLLCEYLPKHGTVRGTTQGLLGKESLPDGKRTHLYIFG